MVESCLELLRSEDGCKTAAYHPSKSQFSVVRKQDNKRKTFRVLRLKRKRNDAATSDSRDLQEAFECSAQQAKVWMAGDAATAPDGDPEEHNSDVDMSDQEDKPAPADDTARGQRRGGHEQPRGQA